MRKIGLTLGAAVLGAVSLAALDASTAEAARRAPPQSFKCKPSKGGAFVDKAHRAANAPLCTFSNSGGYILNLVGSQPGRTSRNLTIIAFGVPDPRTNGNLPATFTSTSSGAGSSTGFYNLTQITGSLRNPRTKSSSWAIDNSNAFSVTLTRYDSVANRLIGKFAGKLRAGDSSPNAGTLTIRNGTFNGVVTGL